MRKLVLLAALLVIVLVAAGPARGQDIVAQAGGEDVMAEIGGGGPAGTTPVSGGPVVLAGIDAEDRTGGPHGPIANYQQLVNTTLSQTSNAGSGILVIGGGKNPADDVTLFWDAVIAGTPESVTYVNGAANIAAQPFSGFRLIAVASDVSNTPLGGLTQDEHDALTARQSDIAAFVNGGGGLIGFSSEFTTPYAYLGGLGGFAISTIAAYDQITPTPEGIAVGITDALDVCCWHQVFDSFPGFLRVLAISVPDGRAAAIGGAQVTVTPTQPCLEARAIAGGATARSDCP